MAVFIKRVIALFMAIINFVTLYYSSTSNPDARDRLRPFLPGSMNITAVDVREDAVFFKADGVRCKLEFTSPHGWRLRTAKTDGAFDDMGAGQLLSYYLDEESPDRVAPISADGQNIFTAPDGSKAELKNGKGVVFYTPSGKQAYDIDVIYTDKSGVLHMAGALDSKEKLYGTGERFNQIDQRGKQIAVYSLDRWCETGPNSYCPIPIVNSSRGCGMFMNRNDYMKMDLGATSGNRFDWQLYSGTGDLYVFATEKMADVLYNYSVITGFAPRLGDWAFGIQICRYYPEFSTPQGVYDMAANMEANGFPWDAVILEGFDVTNRARWDDLQAIADFVHEKGKHLMVYQASGQNIPAQGSQRSYLLQGIDEDGIGIPIGDNYKSITYKRRECYIDITNPDARDWWLNDAWGTIISKFGVGGAKIDFCEKLPDYDYELKFYDGRATEGAHHWFPVVTNSLMFRQFDKFSDDGAMAFARGGGIGAQRYPILWAGDQRREFDFIQAALKAMLSAGLSGLPYMGHDMAGYAESKREILNPDAQVFKRGVEFAAFTVNIESHNRTPEIKRAYDYDDETKNIYRIYTNMHEALRPYLVEFGQQCSETAMPLCRALVLFDEDDSKCEDIWDEYMLGDAFLVAPVMELNKTSRSIYLPKGSWTDLYSGKVYEGGKTLIGYKAPLCKIPVFVNRAASSTTLAATLEALQPYVDEVNRLSK